MKDNLAPNRLLSLDVFRGLTVFAMVLVNNPGDWGHIYAPLEHAAWNGCTPTDLIFPFFLFIVGVSIVFAMETKKADPALQGKLMRNVWRRALTIMLIGWLLSAFPFYNFAQHHAFDVRTMRIPGVLVRIGIVFGICGSIYLKTTRKTQFWLFWILIISYYLIMTLVPVPGFGPANLQPETNLGAWIDRTLIGEAHLWKESKVWDPEGLLGTIPACGTTLFGILIGTWLKRRDRDDATKMAWMFSTGIGAVCLGLLWDLFFPINKALWTSSYVLYAGGLATLGLAFCYWLIDVQGYNRFVKPAVVYGVNAIFVFAFSAILVRTLGQFHVGAQKVTLSQYIFQTVFKPYFSPVNASLAWAICFNLLFMLILWIMYNRKIIIKV
ncbi:acyltransferase family protein [Mucilaginibacter sp. AW1-3]